ncbi:ATP-binding protein [Halorientalis brevis]|uniref:histidine kinase n=1 Tax=Halorientalis brevis TaxID=1126241 RepID=A0ABD6CBL3_9EURY
MRQQRSAQDAERLLYQFAATDPDILWMFSPDWSELQFGDEAYEEVWGRSLDRLEENPTDFLNGIHPDDRDSVRTAMERLSNETPVELECRVTHSEKQAQREVWFEGKPVYDEADEFVAIAGYVRDITDRKQYKRRLEHTNDRLETFNSFLSHDLKNQLQIAKSYLDIAQDNSSDDALDRVGEALDRMNEMTTEVLELPRLGFDSIERDAVSLQHLAEDVWDGIDSAETELIFEEDVTLDVDDGLFRNVLENLFRNAVVHNDAPVTVRIGPLPDEQGFYLQDDGAGIPPAERESIFEFGYSTSGSGIGLALVREIVEIHDGTISVGDAASGGARFEIQGITPT